MPNKPDFNIKCRYGDTQESNNEGLFSISESGKNYIVQQENFPQLKITKQSITTLIAGSFDNERKEKLEKLLAIAAYLKREQKISEDSFFLEVYVNQSDYTISSKIWKKANETNVYWHCPDSGFNFVIVHYLVFGDILLGKSLSESSSIKNPSSRENTSEIDSDDAIIAGSGGILGISSGAFWGLVSFGLLTLSNPYIFGALVGASALAVISIGIAILIQTVGGREESPKISISLPSFFGKASQQTSPDGDLLIEKKNN